MRRNYQFSVAALFLAASVGIAADTPGIRLPTTPVIPQPMPPAPPPDSVARLTGDQLYVIDADNPIRVLVSPMNLVKVTKDTGPIKIRGTFVDGVPGRSETRTYAGKSVYVIEAIGTGRVELLVIPTGDAKTDDEGVIRRTVDVDANLAPIPPPKPDPKPDPKPVNAAWVIVVEETSARTPAIASVLNDLTYWNGLEARGTHWRFYDKDSPDAKAKNYPQMVAGVDLPAILLLDGTGKKLSAAKLPATTAGVDSLLKGN